jgi:hypothetical protein
MNWELFYQVNKAFIDLHLLVGIYLATAVIYVSVIVSMKNNIKLDYEV